MNNQKSNELQNLEDLIVLLNSAKFDSDIVKSTKVFKSRIYEIRNEQSCGSFRDALEIYIAEQIRETLHSSEYDTLCSFLMSKNFYKTLRLIPDEDIRIKYIKRIESQSDKALVLASISDDELKKEYLSGFKKESDRLEIIKSLSSDEEKLAYYDKLTDYHKQAELIASLDSDDIKLEYIYSGSIPTFGIATIAESLKDDVKKEDVIDRIPSDTARLRVILSIKDDDKKKELFESKLRSEEFKKTKMPKLILSLSKDEQLRHFLEYNDGLKFMILRDCDFETQLKLLSAIESDDKKAEILSLVPNDFILKFMAESYGDTTNFWVRTDSEEREANVPRDGREEAISEIVKYSALPASKKIELIKLYVNDQNLTIELLQGLPFYIVLADYFESKNGYINLSQIEDIEKVFDLKNTYELTFVADKEFDFADDKNKKLIEKVKSMNCPKFLLENPTYEELCEWIKIFKDSPVWVVANEVDVGQNILSLEELERLVKISENIIIGGNRTMGSFCYYKSVQLAREIFPIGQDERFELARFEVELILAGGKIGNSLIRAKSLFEDLGFSKNEIQKYGKQLVTGLYNCDMEKYDFLRYELDEHSVDLLHEWDGGNNILRNNLIELTGHMTRPGIKRAVEIMAEEGYISEAFAVSHILDYHMNQTVPMNGVEYGKKLILDLMHEQGLGIKDIIHMTPGAYADVFAVGDYVVKLGLNRGTKELPDHPRVLQSILRFEVDEGNAVNSFIEVQPKINEMGKISKEEEQKALDDLFEVFVDLRVSDIFWGDAARRNIGYIDTPRTVPEDVLAKFKKKLENEEGVTIYHRDSTIQVPASESKKPYLIVLDTDFLHSAPEGIDTIDFLTPSHISRFFEERYIEILRNINQEKNGDLEKKKRNIAKNFARVVEGKDEFCILE